jgi:hypothetical protein
MKRMTTTANIQSMSRLCPGPELRFFLMATQVADLRWPWRNLRIAHGCRAASRVGAFAASQRLTLLTQRD